MRRLYVPPLSDMKLLMISGDRSVLQGKKGAFWYTLEELNEHFERIDVVCPKVPRSKFQAPNKSQIKNSKSQTLFNNVHFHPCPRGLWYQSQWIVKKGRELIKKHHCDVMTVHEYPPFYNGIGAKRLARKTGIPYAVEIHHIVGYPKAASLTELIGKWMSRLYLKGDIKKAKSVRCVSKGVSDVLKKWKIPPYKISVIPSFYLNRELLKKDESAKKIYDIVVCARLVSNKGISDVLKAVAALPQVLMLIVGGGPDRAKLEAISASLKIDDRVKFSGWLPEIQDVYSAIQSGKVFVMNSKSEGGPRIALEAMALGMPIVSTKVGVMPEVIQDGKNGVFTSGKSGDLEGKIQNLLSNDELRNQIGSEAQKILDKYERRQLIMGYAEFLQGIV